MASIDWLTVTPDTGHSGQTTITVSASSLSELSDRWEKISVRSGTLNRTVVVHQNTSGGELSISPARLVLPDAGGSGTTYITCSGDWSISPMRSWLVFSASAGTGSQAITITATPNTSVSDRGATFWVNSGSRRTRLDVVQYKDKYVSFEPSSEQVSAAAGTASVYVSPSSTGTWEVISTPSWVTASPESGDSSGYIYLTYDENESTSARTGNVAVLYNGATYYIGVTQAGAYTFDVTPTTLSFPRAGASSALTITSNTGWRLYYPPFLSGIGSGTGNSAVTVTALQNTGLVKEGQITAQTSDGVVVKYIDCTQDGPVFIYSPTAITANWTGGSATVNITADTTWEIISYPNWATPSTIQGSGNGSVTFTFGVNDSTSSRTESVQFRCRNRVFSVNITQEPRDLIIIPSSVTFTSALATSTTVNLISGYNWEATNVPSWVTLSQTAGTGNIFITLSVGDNPIDRSGTIEFTCNGQQYTLDVQQYGMERFGLWWEIKSTGYTTTLSGDVPSNLYMSINGSTPEPYSKYHNQGDRIRYYSSEIWDYACHRCSDVVELVVGSGITSIGDFTFDICSITSITLTRNITYIGELAFGYNNIGGTFTIYDGLTFGGYGNFDSNNITGVTIENNVTGITGESIFSSNNLGHLTIPDNIKRLKGAVFADAGITSLTIGSGITQLGEDFETSSGLFSGNVFRSVTIPNTVTVLDKGVFSYCSLTSVTIPDYVTYIGNNVFETCQQLSSVTFGNSVTHIGDACFNYTALSEVVIPDSVTGIGESIFSWCNQLTSVTISSGVTNIPSWAFYGCSALTTVYVGSMSVSSVVDDAFYGVPNTGTIYYHTGANIDSLRNNPYLSNWTFTTY